ncbi:MAG TPA: PIG-L deacetylase family protein [Microvirga sp.]|nr:PIG-L deacetylase family protein [Microvirga sp.]
MLDNKSILVLAPHTDDGELGAGASIAKWKEQGSRVVYVAFSTCQDSVPGGWPSNILEQEVREATKVLGIQPEDLRILDYRVRRFSERRQDILDNLLELRKEINPDVVLVPSASDLHQDHSTVYIEALRAFKQKTILSYELPWNNIVFTTSFFSIVEQRHLEAKAAALNCYNSQKRRAYFNRDFLQSQLTFRGVQVGAPLAEVFEIVRAVSF